MGAAIAIDVRDLVRGVDELAAEAERLANLSTEQLLRTVGSKAEEQTDERFETKEAPDGSQWEDWSEDYAESARRRSKSGGILVLEGHLRGDVSARPGGRDAVDIGTPLPYAGMHQATRPFLGISEDDGDDLVVTVEEFVRRHGGLVT